ncbi:UV excision repair protein RAD23 homolog B-like [Anopheles bellator]|uniref:UV excision repair protein RAD23 homolog B-like n=1 Tax=Anopheles bellator TaxID=139047 RepID=UPI002648566C|nr:UV excision repair protein RAD23 homolog B-like [Anopheles bellator]
MNKRNKTTPQLTATGVGSDASQSTLQAGADRTASIKHTDSLHQGGNWSKEIEARSTKDRSAQTGLTTEEQSLSLTSSSTAVTPTSTCINQPPASVDVAKGEKATTSSDAASEDLLNNAKRIIAMGFSEESTTAALEICANNPDRAVEYLLNESVDGLSASAGGGTTGDAWGSLEVLRENPFFGEMMYQMREQPDRLPMLLNMFQYRYPQHMRSIADNPKQFLKLSKDAPQTAPISLPPSQSITTELVDSVPLPSATNAIDRLSGTTNERTTKR